jgi:cytochrome c oxidase subunit 4
MAAQETPASDHIMSVRANLLVFAGLMLLLIATVVAAQFDLGAWGVAIALTIATAKALLIILYFMHVRFSERLAWVFAAGGFIWLGILIGLTLSDYISRGWFGSPPPSLGESLRLP